MDNAEIKAVFQICHNDFWVKYKNLTREQLTDDVLSQAMQEAGHIMVEHPNRLCLGIMLQLLNELDDRAGMREYMESHVKQHKV